MANLKRLKYLRDVVIPHLEGMPTIEDVIDDYLISVGEDNYVEVDYETNINARTETMRKKEGKAILNFNTYLENNTPLGFEPLPVSKDYDCSREGCLVGWYVFMKEEENDPEAKERISLSTLRTNGYNIGAIARHFGIEYGQASMLFGPAMHGWESIPDDFPQEDTLWGASQLNITKLALEARTKYLDTLITEAEIEEEFALST